MREMTINKPRALGPTVLPSERRPPPLRFAYEDGERAFNEWGCNCGPAALAAVLGRTLDEIRPHMGDFEEKHYTNPTLMWSALVSARNAQHSMEGAGGAKPGDYTWPQFGLARIQWGGRWTKPGVPLAARYRQTHWVGACRVADSVGIFDVNCLNSGGWVGFEDWQRVIVPHLLEGYPGSDGTWWITHSIEVW
jgi:hypothetical protein